MDENARPHRSKAVAAYLQSETVTSVPWPAMSTDLNPIKHIWDMLETALHLEWQQLYNIIRPVFAVKHVHFKY
jgi:transposase